MKSPDPEAMLPEEAVQGMPADEVQAECAPEQLAVVPAGELPGPGVPARKSSGGPRKRAPPEDTHAPLVNVSVVHTVRSLPTRSYVQAQTQTPGKSKRLIVEFRARDCNNEHRLLADEAARRIREDGLGYGDATERAGLVKGLISNL